MTLEELAELAVTCRDHDDFAALDEVLLREAQQAADAERWWALGCVDGISNDTFGEGSLPASVLVALVDRALELQSAELLGVVVRFASYDPAPFVHLEDIKPRVQAALAQRASALREAWAGAMPELRAQIGHALALSGVADANDGQRLVALAQEETSWEVVALALLARAGLTGLEAPVGFWKAHVAHEAFFVRFMAVVGLARAGQTLDARACEVVATALREPSLPPRWWGLRTFETWEDSAELAKRLVNQTRLAEPAEVVELLAARPDAGWREAESLRWLAWPDGYDPLGPIARELTAAQRTALRALARPPLSAEPGALHPVGLGNASDVEPFLAEAGTYWTVAEVILPDGSTATWSMARIWKACVWGELGHDEAHAALTGALEPRALFDLACLYRRALLVLSWRERKREPEQDANDHALLVAVLHFLQESDFDLGRAVHAALSPPKPVRHHRHALGVAGLLVLASEELELEDVGWAWLAEAWRRHPLLDDLVSLTPDAVRARLEGFRR